MAAEIIDRGRGPEIKGTRITVYDICDYTRMNWPAKSIALSLDLTTEQVQAALDYIEDHREQVAAEYALMIERDAQGNPPEIRKRLEKSRRKLLALRRRLRKAKKEKPQEVAP